MVPGGLSEARPATPEIQEIADKIRVGDGEYIHVRVFRALPGQNKELELTGYETGKREDDELTGF
uniref:Uncharacterized protein n=1 Tax=Castor canadensis TaxID=51338 RepID=A0A8C0ZVY2_CASCN